MPTFEVKEVCVPLFDVVEAQDQTKWLTAFSAATKATQIHVGATALDFIADNLELDAEGLALDAERYVTGKYRAKARGLGGARLGDLGEILTYLVNHGAGRELVRVVSWRKGGGQTVKGTRFPRPDFIIKDTSGLAALEVKSTEAFDFLDLSDTTKNWTWLQPCSSVGGCREKALPQLAFIDGTPTPQQHSLLLKDGTVVPFPVGKGVAAAVVAVDGRVNTLRSNNKKYKTPKDCRDAGRDCWSCLEATTHFVLVTMENAPGKLSLGGNAPNNGSAAWLRAYQRWSQALSAHDIRAVKSSLGPLVNAVNSWLAADSVVEADVLRSYWGSYLGDAMRSRGFDVEVPGQLGDLSRLESDFEWIRAPVAGQPSRETSLGDIARTVRQARESVQPFMMTALVQRNEQDSETFSCRGIDDFVEFHLVSETWWAQGSVETIESASLIAKRLLSLALEASELPLSTVDPEVTLRAVTFQLGDHEVRIGWESVPTDWRFLREYRWLRYWSDFFDIGISPPWPALLLFGDPRVRLRVMPDGRASLRVSKTLLGAPFDQQRDLS